MIVFWFIVTALATYRISRAIAEEDGPFDIFASWRERLKLGLPMTKYMENHWIYRGFSCAFCVSFWAGFFFSVPIAFKFGMNPLEYILSSLAVSGIVVCIHRYFG